MNKFDFAVLEVYLDKQNIYTASNKSTASKIHIGSRVVGGSEHQTHNRSISKQCPLINSLASSTNLIANLAFISRLNPLNHHSRCRVMT